MAYFKILSILDLVDVGAPLEVKGKAKNTHLLNLDLTYIHSQRQRDFSLVSLLSPNLLFHGSEEKFLNFIIIYI